MLTATLLSVPVLSNYAKPLLSLSFLALSLHAVTKSLKTVANIGKLNGSLARVYAAFCFGATGNVYARTYLNFRVYC